MPAHPDDDPIATVMAWALERLDDPATGETYEECSGTMYKQLLFSQKGPSLGEHVAVTAVLKPMGAAVYKQFLG